MHKEAKPPILYFGTPVVLISTLNEDKTFNLAPMSSIFWLGWRCVIGLGSSSKTTQNLIRTKECVLNLPSAYDVAAVDRLALTTGSNPVPPIKKARGYRFEPNKFREAGLTPEDAELVGAPKVREFPVQLEARLSACHPLAEDDPSVSGRLISFELEILRVHLEESILMEGHDDRIDPDKWRPLIMSFQHFYGLGEKIYPSTLASIPEKMYEMKSR
jgi:flavin reductase (DIM6/NTAB) family NADH-FMN oxidoreductase RutF